MKKIITFLFLAIFFSSISMGITYNLGLSPLKAELIMYPGETQEYDLRLMNGTLSKIDYQMEIGAFKLDENGDYIYLKKNNNYDFSAANWVKFLLNTDHVLVDPLDQRKVTVKVEIPRNLKHGGDYYAMLWANFTPSQQAQTKKASGASISLERRFRFGSILHIIVKGRPSRSKIEVQKISVIDFDKIATSTQRGLEVDVFVKNTGDISYRPTGNFIITSNRKVWGRGKLEMSKTDLVMPGLVRKMFAIYDRSLPSGEYSLKISVKSGKRYVGQKEQKFSIEESTSTAKLLGVNFKISPPQIIFDAKAGYTEMNKIEIYNREFTTVNAVLSAVPIDMDENGHFIYGDKNLKNIKIYPQKFSLREGQKRIVPFSIKTSKNAKGQETFAIKVEVSLKDSPENKSISYVPVLMRLSRTSTYGFKVKKTEKIFNFPATNTKKATTIVRIWIENTGNTFTNFNLLYDIIDPAGNYLTSQAKKLSNTGFLIFPNSQRYVDISLDGYKFKNAGMYSIPFILIYKGDKNKEKKLKMEVKFKITKKELQKLVEGTT